MKLVKLSLVAAMAAGLMASTASATPLDELIKDVDASGMMRIRYTSNNKKEDGDKTTNSTWKFRTVLNLKTKIDDNFFAVLGGRYDYEANGHSSKVPYGSTDVDKSGTKRLDKFYMGYNIAGTTVMVGRQEVGAFFTDDMYGDGIKVVNTDVEGLTLAALFMDALEADSDIGSNEIKADVVNNLMSQVALAKKIKDDKAFAELAAQLSKPYYTTNHNLYGVAAIGSYDPVSFQLWYAVLEDVTKLFAGELGFSFDVTSDVNLNLKAQYGQSSMKSFFKPAIDNAKFFGFEAGTKAFGLEFTAGYVNYKAKDAKYGLVAFEDDGQFISAGENYATDYNFFTGKNDYFFVTAAYEIPNSNVSLGLDYVQGKTKNTTLNVSQDKFINVSDKIKKREVVARASYKVNDQLKFSTYYSMYREKVDNSKYKNNELRFEAKYSF